MGHPAPIPCVVAIAREAVARGIPVALATSGLREHVEDHLHHAGLADLFQPRSEQHCHGRRRGMRQTGPRHLSGSGASDRRRLSSVSGVRGRRIWTSRPPTRQGCHVVDVTAMHAYPSCAGLRRAKLEAARTREWLRPATRTPSTSTIVGVAMVAAGLCLTAAFHPRQATQVRSSSQVRELSRIVLDTTVAGLMCSRGAWQSVNQSFHLASQRAAHAHYMGS